MVERIPIQFETERLNVREFRASDGEFILKLVNTPGWLKYIGNRGVSSVEEAQIYLLTGPMNHYQQWKYGLYRVALREDDKPIGMCGLIRRENLEHPDLGFAFLPEFVNNGYAFETTTAILKLAEKSFQIKTIDAITMPTNKAAIALLNKLGFSYLNDLQLKKDDDILGLYRYQCLK